MQFYFVIGMLWCTLILSLVVHSTASQSCSDDTICRYCNDLDDYRSSYCRNGVCVYRSWMLEPACPNPCSPSPGAYCASGHYYTTCPGGWYCPGNTNTPILCAAGTFCVPGSAAPTQCIGNSLCPVGASISIPCKAVSSCTVGNFLLKCSTLQLIDTDTCPPCPVGSYCPNISNVITCPVGASCHAKRPTNTTFIPCPIGYQCADTASPPVICPRGTFSNATSLTTCYSCPANTYSDSLASTSCTSCGPLATSPTGSTQSLCRCRKGYNIGLFAP